VTDKKLLLLAVVFTLLLGISACAKTYKVGDIGPAGGIVFYDKGPKTEGWRYLEVAPQSYEFTAPWGFLEWAVVGTDTSIGSGKMNTDIMVSLGNTGNDDSAAIRCSQLEINGFKDWFLPSKDELYQMYQVLHKQNKGSFNDGFYWSSSVWDESDDHKNNSRYCTWLQRFEDGYHITDHYDAKYSRNDELNVRAIRAFGGTMATPETATVEQIANTNTEVATESSPAEPEVVKVEKKPVEHEIISLEDLKSNWAWVITNYSDKNQVVAIEYSSPDALENLTLAVDRTGIFNVKYAGQKVATGSNGDYAPLFEGVTGPYWKVTDGSTLEGWSLLLIPESCLKGLLPLTPFENDAHPAASASDIAKIRALKNGRGMMNTEILATDSRGGRIGLFQFNNTDKEGLFIFAYIHGEKIITIEYTTDVYEGHAYWRVDADPDDICYFEATALCETDEGLVIAFLWGAPEGTGHHLMIEKDGQFVDFISDGWYYDHWSNSWH